MYIKWNNKYILKILEISKALVGAQYTYYLECFKNSHSNRKYTYMSSFYYRGGM